MIMKQFNLKEYLDNPNRAVVTRDGRHVRILETDMDGSYPIVAIVSCEGFGTIQSYTIEGKWFNDGTECFRDLFFDNEKKMSLWMYIKRNLIEVWKI